MKEYVTLSLEMHLFFGRIMKEHFLFLLAGFPAKEAKFIRCADQFREEFENELRKTVKLADGILSERILNSGEVVTEFTRKAECQTRNLTGIPIDIKITEAEERLHAGSCVMVNKEMVSHVKMLNRQMLGSLNHVIGDVIFHCHLYPHFMEGMWTLWRIYDRLQDGIGKLPDGEVTNKPTSLESANFVEMIYQLKRNEIRRTRFVLIAQIGFCLLGMGEF